VKRSSFLQPPGGGLVFLLQTAVLCALYVTTARIGLGLGAVAHFAAPVWPPTGISLVAISLLGYRVWPGIALGAFLVNSSLGAPPLAAAGMAAGNTLESLLGVFLLQRVIGFRCSLERLQDVLGLVVLAAGFSTLFSATIGVTSGWLGGAIPIASRGHAWWTWWVGDMVADLVLAPLLFVWAERRSAAYSAGRAIEAGALLVAAAAVSLLVFAGRSGSGFLNAPYLPFPILIWAALRFGPRGAATTTFAISAVAIWGTVHGRGPFARGDLSESLLSLQAFMSVVAVTILVLSADVTQRQRAEEELRLSQLGLERRVQERTAELSRANAGLIEEVAERQRAEEELQASQRELRENLHSLKQVEESLRRSEARLAEAQHVAHLGTWEWEVSRDIISWSDELYQIFGLRPQSFDGDYATYLSLLHPDDRELADETIQRAYEDRRPFELDHRLVRPDGTVRWVHGRGAVIVDAAGEPVRMLGTGQDITERKQMEEELRRARDGLEQRVEERTVALEEANRRKDDFLAMLAHELRNPLGAISNAAHLLERLAPDDPRYQRAQATIERQLRHQTRLLDDLLNVSRIAHGKVSLQCRRLDMVRLIHDSAEDHRRAIEEAGLTLHTELPQESIWVMGDATRLAQILDNLLNNAVKFTEPGGEIGVQAFRREAPGRGVQDDLPARLNPEQPRFPWVSADRLDPRTSAPLDVVLVVRDTGIGIAPDVLPQVFETFTQADRSLDRSRGGLGLGLALVKGLVELHGGEVRAESAGVGHGAAFSVLLPVAPGAVAGARGGEQSRESRT
jgi:PAS domain S-box-containing protein